MIYPIKLCLALSCRVLKRLRRCRLAVWTMDIGQAALERDVTSIIVFVLYLVLRRLWVIRKTKTRAPLRTNVVVLGNLRF